MQGFASGDLERDAAAIRLFADAGQELLLAQVRPLRACGLLWLGLTETVSRSLSHQHDLRSCLIICEATGALT